MSKKQYIGVTKPLNIVTGSNANIDAKYGTYDSIQEAIQSIVKESRAIGLTVGIIENDVVKEYWWKTGTDDQDLILKIDKAAYTKISELENDSKYYTEDEVKYEVEKETIRAKRVEQYLIDNKVNNETFKALMNGIIKQPGVDTYNDTSGGKTSLLSQYPSPQKGWDVLVRKENTRYNWNGSVWVNMETGNYAEDVATKEELYRNLYQKADKSLIISAETISYGELFSSISVTDTNKWTIYENKVSASKQFETATIHCEYDGIVTMYLIDEDNLNIITQKDFTAIKGKDLVITNYDFAIDYESSLNLGLWFSTNKRIIPFRSRTGQNSKTVNNGVIEISYIELAIQVDFRGEGINKIENLDLRVLDLEKGLSSTSNLQEYINSTRHVRLGAGIWEISEPLIIPNNTLITGIRGVTILKLKGDATSIINLNRDNKDISIENITFQGKTPITPVNITAYDIKNRVGAGTDCGIYAAGYAKNIHVRNCEFLDFSLAGIRKYRTHESIYNRTFKITDCVFTSSYYGLLSDLRSEYHTVMGCTFSYNMIGCFIAGGNNYLGICHFDANSVGCVVSGTLGENDSHGSIVGSSFNHNLNYAICIFDITNGFSFSGCHCFFGGILLDNAQGFLFAGGEISCKIEQLNINNAVNMIHSSLFLTGGGGGSITDKLKLSLMGNRFIDGSDSSSINN